jgi:hypothetical protein
MSIKTFLTIHSTVYFIFAFSLFFTPTLLWPLYGLEINDKYALFLSQHNSIFLAGIGIVAFMFREIEAKSQAIKKLLLSLALTNSIGFAITTYACFIGTFSSLGWSDPVFFALLTLACVWQLRSNA